MIISFVCPQNSNGISLSFLIELKTFNLFYEN